jgi:hypothetical protein
MEHPHEETQAPPEADEAEAVLMTEQTEQAPRLGRPPKKINHFQEIRDHITEMMKPGDETLNNALKKIIVRLDRIEGKAP